jgi:hypothetical protein
VTKQTHITDGNWRVTGWNDSGIYAYTMIEHLCVKHPDLSGWCDLSYGVAYRGMPCMYCKKSAPGGIQAVYWFLKDNELK